MSSFLFFIAIVLAISLCLYCLVKLEQHQADVVKKYKSVKLIITAYIIYKVTKLFCVMSMQSDPSLLLCVGLLIVLVLLNILLYKQVVRLFGRRSFHFLVKENLHIEGVFGRYFLEAAQLVLLASATWIGLKKGLMLTSDLDTMVMMDNLLTLSMYILGPQLLFAIFLRVMFPGKLSIFQLWALQFAMLFFLLAIPGLWSIAGDYPMFYFLVAMLIQEFIVYRFVRKKVLGEVNKYGYDHTQNSLSIQWASEEYLSKRQ
ncbi:hypothetical protein [Listeria newyorkensis]|uniref:hypothetical protein n=1 Tax=Listeria newyorkensis TaxID=1497681 RepID=UPI00051D36D7|nr:hypothetical protein [Listeria newyorkensis]KGL43609.1 hypothetical protein EP58_07675 [Listeria newyorkensis]